MTGAIIQARLASARLPRKILLDIGGKPMLTRVIERAQAIPGIAKVVVATPHDELDFIQQAIQADVWWWGGSAEDVLERYYEAAQMYDLSPIVRLTADCPLLRPEACARVLEKFREGYDYVSNVDPLTDGLDCEVFSWHALERAHLGATSPYDREHVTPWMRRNLKCGHVAEPPLPGKWSVDTIEDLERVRAAIQ